MTAFQRKKRDILAALAVPEESYNDLSPKGSIDSGIRELVNEINEYDELVTTSSCAGRIAIYVEGSKAVEPSDQIPTSVGGKGGGRWLFVSHDPVHFDQLNDEQLLSSLGLNSSVEAASQQNVIRAHVRFKFEPLILHILCSSLLIARKVLGSALSAGFRESGISSINDDGDMIMVAVRTNGLAFDSVIGIVRGNTEATVNLLVTPEYLRTLLEISRERFEINTSRKQRFSSSLSKAVDPRPAQKDDTDWEPIEARRARMRDEGLARKQQLHDFAAKNDALVEIEGGDQNMGLFAPNG